jgi:Tfp pilus assembly protein PilV
MKNYRAFTLVETMVAVAILTVAIIAPFTAAQRALDASYAARDQLIAASLAQDGLEYVREVRMNNYLASPSSYDPFGGMDSAPDCRAPNTCTVDSLQGYGAAGLRQCVPTGDCSANPLYVTNTGNYSQTVSGTKSAFTRSISLVVNPASAPNVVRATVVITWKTNNKPYTMTVSEDLYAWL